MFLNYNGDQRVPNIFTKNTAAVHEEPSEVSCDLHNGGDDDTEVIALIDDLDYGVDSDSLSSSQQSNYSLSSAGSDDSNQPSSNGLLLRHSDDGLSFAHPTSFEEVMTFSTRSVDSLTTSSRLHRHPRKRRSAPNYYRLNPQPRRIGVTPRTSTLSADARSSSSMWKRKRAVRIIRKASMPRCKISGGFASGAFGRRKRLMLNEFMMKRNIKTKDRLISQLREGNRHLELKMRETQAEIERLVGTFIGRLADSYLYDYDELE